MADGPAKICSMALHNIGIREKIEDLEDDTEEASVCATFYEHLRDAALAAFPWPFATLRSTLNLLTGETRDGWSNVFALPADCLQTRKVWPSGMSQTIANLYGEPITNYSLRTPRADQRIPFAIEKAMDSDGSVLLCDLDDPTLFYTAKMTDTSKFPALFVDALSWLIASRVALSLTKKQSRADGSWKKYFLTVKEAQAQILNGQQEDMPPDSEFVTGRL